MPLATRQHCTIPANRARVALGQGQDQVVQADDSCRILDHLLVYPAKACNVLSHGALKQFNALRQISHIRTKLIFIPGEDICTIEPHLATNSWPNTHQQAGQSGLARRRGSHYGQHLTWVECERHAPEDECLAARRGRHQPLYQQLPFGPGQGHPSLSRWHCAQHSVQPGVGIPNIDDGLPLCDELDQGCQHPATQYGANDHEGSPTVELVFQQKPGAKTQQKRAHCGLHKLREGLVKASPVRCQGLALQKLFLPLHPAAVNSGQHSHRLDDLRVPQAAVCILLRCCRTAVGCQQWRLRTSLIAPAHKSLDHRCDHRSPSQNWTDGKCQHQGHQRNWDLHDR